MMLAAADYGPLKDVVASAGAIMAAGGAILLAFKHRANWEPSEQDIPSGAQRVGALIASVVIALMWAGWRSKPHIHTLNVVTIVMLGLTVIFLIGYGYLVAVQTYQVVKTSGTQRVIGGFWLTAQARQSKADHNVTTQALLEGAAYDRDLVWSRSSRALAKAAFQLGYMGLTICGTVAVAAAAIRLGLAIG